MRDDDRANSAPSFDDDPTSAAVVPAPTPTQAQLGGFSLDDDDEQMLGEYRIEGKIGEGGMGQVFAAIQPVIGKRVAIKVLNKALCEDQYSVERFLDEARVVNQIQHPNIVDIFAFGQMLDGRHYFVMELLRGESLRARIQRGPLPLDETITIAKALLRALAAAHAKGVIHRDIKPDNIFLVDVPGEPARVKLLDFGLAKLAHEDHHMQLTATGAMVGTPQYIAPEQAKGYAIDGRADIYSLGGVVFELLTGRPPFVADNAMEVVAMHLMEPPKPPSTYAPGIPPLLDTTITRMLAKDASKRPTLDELTFVFDRVRDRAPHGIGGSMLVTHSGVAVAPITPIVRTPVAIATNAPITPLPDPLPPPVPRTPQRRRWPIAAALGALVAVALVIALVIGSGSGELSTTPGDAAATAVVEVPPQHGAPPPSEPARVQTPHEVTRDAVVDTPAPPVVAKPGPKPPPRVADERLPPHKKQDPPKRVAAVVVDKKPDPPADGKLRVVLRGNSGEVLVDGKSYGTQDGVFIVTLPVGAHHVTVRFPKERAQHADLSVAAGASASREFTAVYDADGLMNRGTASGGKR